MGEYISRDDLLELYTFDGPINETGVVPLPVIRQNILDMPAADVIEPVRCDNCILHENCLTEDTFRIARIDNPYCCVGRQANV